MFVAVLKFFFFAADVLNLLVEIFFLLFQTALGTLDFSAAFFCVAVKLLSQPVYLFFALGENVALRNFGLLSGLLYNALGFRKGSSEFFLFAFFVICKTYQGAYGESGDYT